jgi:hypothetical protein
MPFATLCHENRAKDLMRELGISAAVVAIVCRVEASKLNMALRHLRELSNEEGLRLTSTLSRLLEIRDAIRPFALDLKDPKMVTEILNAFEDLDSAEIHQKVRAVLER